MPIQARAAEHSWASNRPRSPRPLTILVSPRSADSQPTEGGVPAPPTLRHAEDPRVRRYASTFSDLMEMRAPAAVVSSYLDRHEGWFRRCAAPMTVTGLSLEIAQGHITPHVARPVNQDGVGAGYRVK